MQNTLVGLLSFDGSLEQRIAAVSEIFCAADDAGKHEIALELARVALVNAKLVHEVLGRQA